MAFSLSGLFQNHILSDSAAVGEAQQTSREAIKTTDHRLLALTPGKTINGEILGNNGSEIQIRLSTDLIVTARMEQPIAAGIGQNVMFEVKSNTSGTLALRPLFENLAMDGNAGKALAMAGLQANERSVEMTLSMMEEGMNVGREALQKMYRQVLAFPEGDVRTIVQMSRLDLPVTAESMEQFQAYRNYEHKLLDAFSQAAEQIPQTVENVFSKSGSEAGNALIQKLLEIFELKPEQINPEAGTEIFDGNPGDSAPEGALSLSTAAGAEENAEVSGFSGPTIDPGKVLPTGGEIPPEEIPGEEQAEIGSGSDRVVVLPESERALSRGETGELLRLLKSAGTSSEILKNLQNGGMAQTELYRVVKALAQKAQSDPESMKAVKDVFLSRGFQKIIKNGMMDQWTIRPEELEEKQVARLYERITEQSKQLARALSQAVGSESPLARSVNQIRENVDFLNQLNHLYTFVQLPLRLRGGSAHGDLYVYTNKKSLARKEGDISALLQLDMEHLGFVSVYVAMQQQKVTTNFYLADEESLTLIEDHLELLTKRLEDRGYSVKAGCILQKEQSFVMDEILKNDKSVSVMSKTSFDVRA